MRELFISDREANMPKRFASNYIKTTKYNALTFLPLAILFQFKRMANVYFLIISILSCFSQISPYSGASSFAPFIFVIFVSVFREGIEDLGRYRSDRETNSQKVTRINDDGSTEEITSALVQVGDLLLIPEDTLFPSDLILIESSSEGVAFIQTSSLDGEKNLKKRMKPKDFNLKLASGDDDQEQPKNIKTFKGTCECDEPNAELYEFKGNLKVNQKSYSLSASQLLLKGSILKNTSWIIGFVVYSGNQTKLMMNAKAGRFKMSGVEKKMNNLVIYILLCQILLSLIVSLIGIYWFKDYASEDTYLEITDSIGTNWVKTFFTYFLLLNTLIPISLIVTIEVVKVLQARFIEHDVLMYSEERDRHAKVSSASLNEELGQIKYIFSDKTGTLTRNIMEFKLCYIGYELYGDRSILKSDAPIQQSDSTVLRQNSKQGTQYTFKNKMLEDLIFKNADDSNMFSYEIHSKTRKRTAKFENQKLFVNEFLKLLSAAHQCQPEKKVSNGIESLFYQGPSPDEVTLVEFAQQHGYEYYFGNDNVAKVRIQLPATRGSNGEVLTWDYQREIEFEVFRRMEFNSDRKRMSILVKDPEDGHYKLYCKGADSIIKERLEQSQIDQDMMDTIDDFLTKASVKGYRTLLMAMKVLDEGEVRDFMRKCEAAEANIETREKVLQEIYSELEQDLVLVGATCVEDRLQDNVPETIADLQKAGIKIWMLTGDKLETAENIGYSCRLLTKNMEVIKCSTLEDVQREFNAQTAKINEQKMKKQIPRGVLVEAGALKHILGDETYTIKRYFLKIAKTCEAVICCRVSPAQKADVVKLVKDDDESIITLAIGDGANDVPMIMEAHIGIGLYGNEGMRAVQSSDYALGEFQFLWRLLLVHGRWSYIRIADLILYFFYKNIVFTLPQAFYAFIAAYSGQTVYDSWYISFYNLFFTSLPLAAKALFDQDVNPVIDGDELKRFLPSLYYIGQRSTIFNTRNFIIWLISGIFHSLIIFLLPYGIYKENVLNDNAQNNDMWSFSVTSFTAVIIIVTLKLMASERFFTWINHVCIFILSLGIYFCYIWASNYTGFSSTEYSMVEIFSSNQYYLTVALCAVLAYIFDMSVISYKFELMTGPTDLIRKLISLKEPLSKHEAEFERLYREVKTKIIDEDLKREEFLEKRREKLLKKKMAKLGKATISPQRDESIIIEEYATPVNEFEAKRKDSIVSNILSELNDEGVPDINNSNMKSNKKSTGTAAREASRHIQESQKVRIEQSSSRVQAESEIRRQEERTKERQAESERIKQEESSRRRKDEESSRQREIPDEECNMEFDSIENAISQFWPDKKSLMNISEELDSPEPRGVPKSSPTKPSTLQ